MLIKPYKRSGSSLLRTAGDPCRDRLREYAKYDMLDEFFVEVTRDFLPVIAVPICDLLGKCVLVSTARHNYVINIPNNFEHT